MYLGLSFLLLFLTGCESTPSKEYVYIYKQPPYYLTEDCLLNDIKGDDVAAAIEQSIMNIEALRFCTQDKKALRSWYELNNSNKISNANKANNNKKGQ